MSESRPKATANTRDEQNLPPRVKYFLSLGNVAELPDFSIGPKGDAEKILMEIKKAGYDGVQGGDPALVRKCGLELAAGGRVNLPGEALPAAKKARDEGAVCQTLHVGWGLESDDEMNRLAEDILTASEKSGLPLYVETHRATMIQDLWRTVELVKRFPELRFNGDFSHWYTGLEMVYGGFEKKLQFIKPVLERTRFIHGRIGDPGSMQVKVEGNEGESFVKHFKSLWKESFSGFLASAKSGDFMIFCPELLWPKNFYARLFPSPGGGFAEETDRWKEALLYLKIAGQCFEDPHVP